MNDMKQEELRDEPRQGAVHGGRVLPGIVGERGGMAWAITAITFLVPIFFLPIQSFSLEFEKYIFIAGSVLLALLAWLIFRFKDGLFVFPKSMLLAFGGSIVLAYLISAAFAPSFWNSFSGLLYDRDTAVSALVFFVLMCLASVAIRTRAQAFYLYGALFIAAFIVGLFQIVHIFFPGAFNFGFFSGVNGNMVGKWNDLGVFFGLIALLATIMLQRMAARKVLRAILWVLLALALVLLILVNFSLVWELLALLSLAFFWWNRVQAAGAASAGTGMLAQAGTPGTSLPALALMSISLIFGASSLAAWVFPSFVASHPQINIGGSIVDKLGLSQIEVRPSWTSTWHIITATLAKNLVLGAGPNRFSSAWALYKPSDVNTTIFWNTDFQSGFGLIPSFAVTTGLLGALAWFLFGVVFLFRAVKTLMLRADDPQGVSFVIASLFGAFYLWVVAIVYVPSTAVFALAFITTGVWVGLLSGERIISVIEFAGFASSRRAFFTVLIMLITVLATLTGIYALAEKTLSLVRFHESQTAFLAGNFSQAESAMNRAANLNPQDVYYRSLAQINASEIQQLLTVTSKNLPSADVRAQFQTLFTAEIRNGQKAVSIDTTNPANYLTLGDIYASAVPLSIGGSYENASKSYAAAIALGPMSPLGPLSAARLEAIKGNLDHASSYLDQALALKTNYTDARYLLAQIEATKGNTSKAIDQVAIAASLDPNNVGLLFQLGLLYYNTRNYAKVVPVLERAVALSPQYSNARYFLGLSYWTLGRHDAAVQQFQTVAQYNPDNTEVQKMLANMGAGLDPFTGFNPPPQPPEKRSKPPVDESKSKTAKSTKVEGGASSLSN